LAHDNPQQGARGGTGRSSNGTGERNEHVALLERAAKTAAVAALAGTATAVAASKALSARGASGEQEGGGRERGKQGASGRAERAGGTAAPQQATGQLRSIAGQAFGTVAEVLTPVAESFARSAGAWAATASPEPLRDTVFPSFVEAFQEARGRGGSAAKSRRGGEPAGGSDEADDEREAERRQREARREERRQERSR
jgi:hypothetical protein